MPSELMGTPPMPESTAVLASGTMTVVVPLSAGWNDVGSWASLQDALPADSEGNVLRGDVMTEDATDCLLFSTHRLVAAVGLDSHVVIETKDAVLVAPKDRVRDVKLLVEHMKRAGRSG